MTTLIRGIDRLRSTLKYVQPYLAKPQFWVCVGLPLAFSVLISIFFPSEKSKYDYSSSFERTLARSCEGMLVNESPGKNLLPADMHDQELTGDACYCFVKATHARLTWAQLGKLYSRSAQQDPAVQAVVASEFEKCSMPLRAYWTERYPANMEQR